MAGKAQIMNKLILDLDKLESMINSPNHEVRCHAIYLLKQRTYKLQEMQNQVNLLNFQIVYFARRGKEPTVRRTTRLCNGMQRLGRLLINDIHKTRSICVKYFQTWKRETFGTREAINRIFKQRIKFDLDRRDKLLSLCSYKNQCRLNRVSFEAFQKWKIVVSLNYPLIPRQKEMGHVLPYQVLHRINKELYNSYKIELDQIDFYRIFSTAFYTLKRIFNSQRKNFFMKAALTLFMQSSENGALIRKKCTLPVAQIKYESTIPAIFAMQVIKSGYKRLLLGAFLKLKTQIKLIEMRDRVKKAKVEWKNFQQKARAELLLKILVRSLKQPILKRFYKWKLKTRLRRATILLMKEFTSEEKQEGTEDFKQYRKNHKKIKDLLDSISAKYAVSMSKEVIANIGGTTADIKDAIDREFITCVEEMLNELT